MDRRDRDRDRGPPERVNQFFVVDTGFVEPDRNTCFEFQRTGRCTKGEACRFSHGAPPSAQGPHGCASSPRLRTFISLVLLAKQSR